MKPGDGSWAVPGPYGWFFRTKLRHTGFQYSRVYAVLRFCMNNDFPPAQPLRVPGLPPPPVQRVALPPDYQRAQEQMRAVHEAAIPVARLADPPPKTKGVSIAGVSIASPVAVAIPVPVSRPAPGTRTEPIVRAAPLVAPVAVAVPMTDFRPAPNAKTEPVAVRPQLIADPVAVAIAEPVAVVPAAVKPMPKIKMDLQRPKVSDEPSSTLSDPSSRLW